MNENVRAFTSANFEAEVLKSSEPVLVDFWAEWCPPCRALGPSIDAAATQFQGRMKIGKLNVDDSDDVAGRYGVRSIPTLIVFRDGKVVEQRVGGMSTADLTKFLEAHATTAPAAVRT